MSTEKLDELIARKAESEKKPNRFRVVAYVAVALIVLALAYFSYSIYSGSVNESDSDSALDENAPVEQSDRSLSGESAEQDRADAVQAAYEIIAEAQTVDGDVEETLAAIDSGDRSGIPEGLHESIHMVDAFEQDEELENVAYQSVIAVSNLMIDGEVEILDGAEAQVYLDQETGIAEVPLLVFNGIDSNFTFTMVYVDDEWKLAPYSLIESIRMSANISEELEDAPL